MKTVFKVGVKVYDQLFFPDKEGVVTSTNFIPEKSFFDKEKDFEEDYEHPYPIEVDFKGQQALYKNDGSGLMDFPTLSTKPYEIEFQGFEQKASVTTFEEVLKNCKKVYPPNIHRDVEYKEIYPSKELSDAAEALRRLLFFRDYYNEDWKPNWNNDRVTKWTIECSRNNLIVTNDITFSKILCFKTEQLADKFLEEQRELLEIAKPLL